MERARFGLHDALKVRRTCVIGGQPIKVEASNPGELYRIHRYLTREPDTVQWIADYVKPGDVFYDVGANIGLYSIFTAKRLGGQVRVYSFEPESQNYASLNRHVYINGLSDCIATLCLALTESTCVNTFYVRGHLRAGEAIHQFGSPLDDKGVAFSPVHQQGMIGVSLDDLCYVYGLPVPNHIKIDVDGYEKAVIRGASKCLGDHRLKTVLLEITEIPSRAEDIRAIFDQFSGAGLYALKKSLVSSWSDSSRSYNALFVRDAKSLSDQTVRGERVEPREGLSDRL
jgi:FkbM family methyltransferase